MSGIIPMKESHQESRNHTAAKKNNITIPFKPAEYLMDDQYDFSIS
jgi:hypothetical protein